MHLPFPLQLIPSQSLMLTSQYLPVKPASQMQVNVFTPSTQCLFSPHTTPTQLSWQGTDRSNWQFSPAHHELQYGPYQYSAQTIAKLVVMLERPIGSMYVSGAVSTPTSMLLIVRLASASHRVVFDCIAATLICAPWKGKKEILFFLNYGWLSALSPQIAMHNIYTFWASSGTNLIIINTNTKMSVQS